MSKEKRKIAAKNSRRYKAVYEYFKQDRFDEFFQTKGHEIDYAGKHEDSLKFSTDRDSFKCLTRVFNIALPAKAAPDKNYSLFKARFLEAAYGNGHEANEITQLNSSALAALMFFYNVSDSNPLILSFTIKGKKIRLKFTSVILEKENPVFAANYPSSIDIALYGNNEDSGNPAVLFLESKFGEYLTVRNCSAGKSYKNIYELIEAQKTKMGVLQEITFKTGDICHILGPEHYCEGLKQMVSHFIGAKNSYELNVEGREIYLGSILFDFNGIEYAQTKLDSYRKVYEGLAKVLNDIDDNRRINLIDSILTYRQVFFKNKDFKCDKEVIALYFGE